MRTCPGAPDDPDASQAGNVGARSWLTPDVEENGIDPDERARPLHRPINCDLCWLPSAIWRAESEKFVRWKSKKNSEKNS
jgi:hypothetical protein